MYLLNEWNNCRSTQRVFESRTSDQCLMFKKKLKGLRKILGCRQQNSWTYLKPFVFQVSFFLKYDFASLFKSDAVALWYWKVTNWRIYIVNKVILVQKIGSVSRDLSRSSKRFCFHLVLYGFLEFAVNRKGRKHQNYIRTIKNIFWKYGDLAEYGNTGTLPIVAFT